MIDTEVLRLRRLRNSALKARAIAAALESVSADTYSARQLSTVSAGAVGCWRIARIVTGRLRAHPYMSYQQGPGELRSALVRVSAKLLAVVAKQRGRSLQTLSAELRRVVRELDDARALTWSTDLSDTFGRSQTQIRKVINELDAGARGSCHDNASRVEERAVVRPSEAGGAAANWPYLAF